MDGVCSVTDVAFYGRLWGVLCIWVCWRLVHDYVTEYWCEFGCLYIGAGRLALDFE